MRKTSLAAIACSIAVMLTASASITVESYYRVGEDGVGFAKLPKDSSGQARDFVTDAGNSEAGVTVETTGAAPGSTQYYKFNADLTGFSDTAWDPPENNVGVECWAQSHDLFFDTFSTVGTLVFGTGNNLNGIGILYNDFGAGFIGVIGNINYVGLPYIPARTNEWVHLAVVRDNGVTTFYVNGVARTPIRTDGVNDSTVAFMACTSDATKTNFNGAIDEARIFTFQPGEFHPNDLLFYQATNTKPYVTTFRGALDGFLIRLQDKATAVNPDTIVVQLDGTPVTVSKSQASGLTTIQYTAPAYLASGSSHTVNLVFADTAGTFQTNNLPFTVAAYVAVPPGYAMPPGSVDTTKPGFRIRPFQTDPLIAAQPNSLAWTEDQLLGLYGENIADLTGTDAQGFVDVTGVINLSVEAGTGTDRGNFTEDLPFPGIPGLAATTGNSSMELLTFLQFPTAGVYRMGVNSDDGFKVTTGRNPRDRFALVLGQFDGGRGASDTVFTLTIPEAGFYPFRLIWENGNGELPGNQANCEWFTVQANGSYVLVNSPASTVKAYRVGPLPPYVSRVLPLPGTRGVLPSSNIEIDLTDATTQVNQSSIQMAVNGGTLATPTTVTKTGSVTKAVLTPASPFAPNTLNTAQLAWADTGTYTATNSWEFTTLSATLPPVLWSPPGSGDNTKPGFRVKTWQVDKFTANGTAGSGIVNEVGVGNSLLLGVWGDNMADLSQAVNGEFTVPTTINWNRDADGIGAEIGSFQAPDYADTAIPGIPGSTGGYEDLAVEVLTYVEFPTAGVYTMGVNSDDGFRVTAAEAAAPGSGAVNVLSPEHKAGNYCALATYAANGGLFGGPWPQPRLVRPLVAVTDGTTENNGPGVNVGDSYMFLVQRPVNAADLNGNIAVTRRGGGITFAQKAKYCQDAGALAVIFVNRADQAGQKPWGMGGSDPSVTIPCIMIDWADWEKFMDVTTTNLNTTQVTLSLTDDDSPMLGQFDGGKGSSDVLFSFFVPQAGVYPVRLMYEQGQGGANCELFSLDSLGNKLLVNDRTNPQALKAFRARTAAVQPTIGFTRDGSNLILTFTGTLQSADNVPGSFTDVAGATSPKTIPFSEAAQRFYRARR